MVYYTCKEQTDRPQAGKEIGMKELAMDIIKMNNRGILAKAELEKMMGCKLDDMTDSQKTIGLAMLVSFESQWNK